MRRTAIWWVSGAIALALTLVYALGVDGWQRPVRTPRADAAYYYAYLPSLVLDGDLDFTNQYAETRDWYGFGVTSTRGRPGNMFGIGPAVFQLPLFLAGHGLAVATGSRTDGFSDWEYSLVQWTGVVAAMGTILLAFAIARRRVTAIPAYAGTVIALVSGPLFYYVVRQPGYAHIYAALFATLLIERWDASFTAAPRSLMTWIVLGSAAGAAILARPQLATWLLLLPVAAIDDVRRRGEVRVRTLAVRWGLACVAIVIVFSPQLLAWHALYGEWFVIPQGAGFMRWDEPMWSEVLFSSRYGLFAWSPLYAVCLGGVLVLARSERRLPTVLLLGFGAQMIVNGAAWDWWAGGSFGGRRFDSCFVVFALGGAVMIERGAALAMRGWRAGRTPARLVAGVIGVAGVVMVLIACATIDLAMRASVIGGQLQRGERATEMWTRRIPGVSGALAGRLASLVSLPVRAVFAWRHDVDLVAYDRLVGVHALGESFPGTLREPDTTYEQFDTRQQPPTTSGLSPRGRYARMVSTTAAVRIGLNRRDPVSLRFELQDDDVTIRWNGDVLAVRRLGPVVETAALPTRRGVNTLEIEAHRGTLLGPIELFAAGAGK